MWLLPGGMTGTRSLEVHVRRRAALLMPGLESWYTPTLVGGRACLESQLVNNPTSDLELDG